MNTQRKLIKGTEENVILVAEFLGMETKKGIYGGRYYNSDDLVKAGLPFSPGAMGNAMSELPFHESWDWLMPVIKKIAVIGSTFDTDTYEYRRFEEIFLPGGMLMYFLNGSIELVYERVIEFIKWHNEQALATKSLEVVAS